MLGGIMDRPELKGYQAEKHFREQSGHGNVPLKTYYTMLLRGIKRREGGRKENQEDWLFYECVFYCDCLQPCCRNDWLCVLSIVSCGFWFLSWYVN